MSGQAASYSSPARARGSAPRTARAFAKAGWKVVLAARNGDKLAEVVASLGGDGGNCLAVACDVTDPASVEALFAAHRRHPRPPRRGLQQRRRQHRRQARRRRHLGRVAQGRLGQPRRRLPDRLRRLPHDARPVAPGRAHHQQRLDLGLRPALRLGRLHRLEARDHRASPSRSRSTAAPSTSPAARSTSATPPPT